MANAYSCFVRDIKSAPKRDVSLFEESEKRLSLFEHLKRDYLFSDSHLFSKRDAKRDNLLEKRYLFSDVKISFEKRLRCFRR